MNTNSKSSAAGVGLYISQKLDFLRRRDLGICADGIESCWIELLRKRRQSIIVASVYRYPSSDRDLFFESLKTQLEGLINKGHEIFISGDININFFPCGDFVQKAKPRGGTLVTRAYIKEST